MFNFLFLNIKIATKYITLFIYFDLMGGYILYTESHTEKDYFLYWKSNTYIGFIKNNKLYV